MLIGSLEKMEYEDMFNCFHLSFLMNSLQKKNSIDLLLMQHVIFPHVSPLNDLFVTVHLES